jgi:alkylhydroperoxidase family enzyme
MSAWSRSTPNDSGKELIVGLVPYLDETTAPAGAVEALARVRERRGYISMVNQVLANSPTALDAFDRFSRHINTESPLDKPLRELVILRMTQLLGNAYEWRRHIPIALASGITQAQVEAVAAWRASDGFDERQRLALGLAEEIVDSGGVSTTTGEALTAVFAPAEVLNLVLLTGWHQLVGTLIISLGLIEDDEPVEPLVPFVAG